jgi:hypothetical protein
MSEEQVERKNDELQNLNREIAKLTEQLSVQMKKANDAAEDMRSNHLKKTNALRAQQEKDLATLHRENTSAATSIENKLKEKKQTSEKIVRDIADLRRSL